METEFQSRAKASSTATFAEDVNGEGYSRDDRDLIRLGKNPVLKRNFGFMSILGFSCTVLITWEGMLIVSTQSLVNGGPAGVIWGYLIVWIGTLSSFTVLSELASMAPTAGGQYHWVAMLAPDSSRRFLSYITGWITLTGWQAATASAAYLTGSLLQSIIIMLKPDYTPQPWQTMLFFWAIVGFAVFINTIASKTLVHFERLILILHILGFFSILIPLVYLAPHGDTSLFTTFVNEGGWPTRGLSFMVGLPTSVFSLVGADSAVHMAEEIKNASTVVPRAILFSIGLNGALGFAMMIAYLFCLGDLQAVLESQETLGYPFLFVFQTGTNSTPGAAVMGLIVVVLGLCCTVSVLASSSRMLWSFARDRGVPIWRTFVKLERRTSIPIYTIAFTTIVSVLLSLITLGSSVAFSNIVNLTVAGLYSSYLLSCMLLLWRRTQTQGIKPYDLHISRVGPGNLQWGPWRIPGILGVLNNAFACMYLLLLWFWSFWPPAMSVTPESMNFNVLTFGAVVLFAVAWYAIRARKVYIGPIVEVTL
ncbi:putative GABA permease [Annulohypoxylon truncatum]|uniref:putative GABA permease n=1 Tax=Annulohypoxylon truncatum TaxID=327061 RepID=UPI002007E70C|nr:putative GABA permease [Annulohypoxylon truncatum]KAI1214242.1 putative GABA permease [Annulohypoxylon truncatum]